jgi:hypothetical protein
LLPGTTGSWWWSSTTHLRSGNQQIWTWIEARQASDESQSYPRWDVSMDDNIVVADIGTDARIEQEQNPTTDNTTDSFLHPWRRHLSKRGSDNFYDEWNHLDPNQRIFALVGLVLAFLFCWCFMTCVCNCLRSCCYGGAGRRPQRCHYTEIDSMGRTVVYHDTYGYSSPPTANRPCLNVLWAACCFECCCRDNQDFDCCQIGCPLLLAECCCPAR